MRVLVIVVVIVVVVIVTWESKANSSSSLTELQTGTELGNFMRWIIILIYLEFSTGRFTKEKVTSLISKLHGKYSPVFSCVSSSKK